MKLRSGKVKRGVSRTRDSSSKRRKLIDGVRVSQSNDSSVSLSYVGLPPEIWYQICQLILEMEHPILVDFRRRINRPVYTSKRLTKAPRLPDCRISSALASTSRWMYNVATQIYYTKNTFRLAGCETMRRFFASIGTRNVDLITSITLSYGWRGKDEEPPWRAISKMASIKNIVVLYPKGFWQRTWLGSSDPRTSAAATEFNEFIKCCCHTLYECTGNLHE